MTIRRISTVCCALLALGGSVQVAASAPTVSTGTPQEIDLNDALDGHADDLLSTLFPVQPSTYGGADRGMDGQYHVAVTLPVAAVAEPLSLDLTEDYATGDEIPVFDAQLGRVDSLSYAVWSGSDALGNRVTISLVRNWESWSAVRAEVVSAQYGAWSFPGPDSTVKSFGRAPEHSYGDADPGSLGLDTEFQLPLNGLDEPAARNSTGSASGDTGYVDAHPAGFSAPQYPIPGTVEARTSDIVVFAARGVTPTAALGDALTGVADFNTTMDNSSSSASPIADVSLRLIGIGAIDYSQTWDVASDQNATHSKVDPIRLSLGADLSMVVFPNKWLLNGGSYAPACGASPYFGLTGVITVSSGFDCDQAGKMAFAHEVGHLYDLSHDDVQPSENRGDRRGREIDFGGGVYFRTLMVNQPGGRSRYVSNPETVVPGHPSYRTGIAGQRENAKRVHETATTIAGRNAVASTNNGRYTALAKPVRIMDTRNGLGGYSTAFSSGEVRQLAMIANGIPSNTEAVAATVTVVGNSQNGNLQVRDTNSFPVELPTISNFVAYQVEASSTIITLGSYATIYMKATGNPHVIIDVYGYFGGSLIPATGYNPLGAPERMCDTRNNTGGCGTNPIAAGAGKTVDLSGQCASGSTGAMVNITALGQAGGNLQAMRTSTPGVGDWSTVNYQGGEVIANLAFVPLTTSRTFWLQANAGAAHAIVDLMGCFGTGGFKYTPLSAPTRIRDTRNPPIGGGVDIFTDNETQNVAATAATPVGAGAFVNITAANNTADSYLQAFPVGTTTVSSIVNITPGSVPGNHTAVTVDGSRLFTIARGGNPGASDVIVDQFGYFS